jgi:hypothetical protein
MLISEYFTPVFNMIIFIVITGCNYQGIVDCTDILVSVNPDELAEDICG